LECIQAQGSAAPTDFNTGVPSFSLALPNRTLFDQYAVVIPSLPTLMHANAKIQTSTPFATKKLAPARSNWALHGQSDPAISQVITDKIPTKLR